MGNVLCTNTFIAVVFITTEENIRQAKFATVTGLVKYVDIICMMNNDDPHKEFVLSRGNTPAYKILKSKTQTSITNLLNCV